MDNTGNHPGDSKWRPVVKQKLTPGFFAGVDLIVGRPPCQPYADEGSSQSPQKWGGDPLFQQGAAFYPKTVTLKKGGPHL